MSSAPSAAPSTKKRTPATPTLSDALAVTLTEPLTNVPAAGAVMAAVGAVLSTVTVTPAEVVVLPAASRATAVRGCGPSAAAVVSQEAEYGAAVFSAPSGAPSTKKRTPTTPTLSDELALTLTEPLTN